nr:hypothetical protein B0A51_14198 [Rachicladosporium sp. CCFEE 5018]
MAAALAVLDLPELLENIILRIDDWKKPFVLLRVNQRFKATIENSIHLKRKMWFTPTSKDVEVERTSPCNHKDATEPSATLYNPLLIEWHSRTSIIRCPGGNEFGMELHLARDFSIEATVYTGGRASDLRVLSMGDSWRRVLCTQKSGVSIAKLDRGVRKNRRVRRKLCVHTDVKLAKYATMGDLIEGVNRCFDEFLERGKQESSAGSERIY